jgi:hypothetical protein
MNCSNQEEFDKFFSEFTKLVETDFRYYETVNPDASHKFYSIGGSSGNIMHRGYDTFGCYFYFSMEMTPKTLALLYKISFGCPTVYYSNKHQENLAFHCFIKMHQKHKQYCLSRFQEGDFYGHRWYGVLGSGVNGLNKHASEFYETKTFEPCID